MERFIKIGAKHISNSSGIFIIAEAGVNHNGDFSMAKKLVKEAHASGADCIKFQTFKAERVVTKDAPKAGYQLKITSRRESQLEMLRKLELSPQEHIKLKQYAEKLGLVFLSTPYNFEDIELLESIGVKAYKVASGQIIEHAFLRKVAATGKPIFLSTGMANLKEIGAALDIISKEGNGQVVLLQCTTNYPSRIEDANISVIGALKKTFKCLVGYSDHTIGYEAAIAAVALGAAVIEKHFTLDKKLPGPDHSSSLTPKELKSFVEKIRRAKISLGSPRKEPTKLEVINAVGMRRSIVVSCGIPKGKRFTQDNITFKRPATGIRPEFYDRVLGKKAACDIQADEILRMDMIKW